MNQPASILVADDDDNDRLFTVGALEQSRTGLRVAAVRDGVEAIDYLYAQGGFKDRPSGSPDLLLLDLHMPRLDGWEVLQRLKSDEHLRTIPVVVFTSSARDHDVARCYELGANAYVVKPVAFDEFGETVRAIRLFWAERNRPPPAALATAAAFATTGDKS